MESHHAFAPGPSGETLDQGEPVPGKYTRVTGGVRQLPRVNGAIAFRRRGVVSLVCWLLVLCMGTSFRAGGDEGVPVQFVDVAAATGIDFVHTNGLSSEKRLPETTGSGCAFFDYDGDDDLDLYLINSGDLVKGRGEAWNRLYRNDGGRFVDVTEDVSPPYRAGD